MVTDGVQNRAQVGSDKAVTGSSTPSSGSEAVSARNTSVMAGNTTSTSSESQPDRGPPFVEEFAHRPKFHRSERSVDLLGLVDPTSTTAYEEMQTKRYGYTPYTAGTTSTAAKAPAPPPMPLYPPANMPEMEGVGRFRHSKSATEEWKAERLGTNRQDTRPWWIDESGVPLPQIEYLDRRGRAGNKDDEAACMNMLRNWSRLGKNLPANKKKETDDWENELGARDAENLQNMRKAHQESLKIAAEQEDAGPSAPKVKKGGIKLLAEQAASAGIGNISAHRAIGDRARRQDGFHSTAAIRDALARGPGDAKDLDEAVFEDDEDTDVETLVEIKPTKRPAIPSTRRVPRRHQGALTRVVQRTSASGQRKKPAEEASTAGRPK